MTESHASALAPLGVQAASELVAIPPGDLKPWPSNARAHGARQLTQLCASIRQFGFTLPVLIDETQTILAGHGRVLAAIRLGLTTVPTRAILGLSTAQKRAYVIADNKLASLSTWDEEVLHHELKLLIDDEFCIESTGFSTAEVDLILEDRSLKKVADADGLIDADVDPEVVSARGDLWILGNHRLLCGDATDKADYQTLLDGQQAQMTVTDPPYNVKIAGNVSGNGKKTHKEFVMASGEMSNDQFTGFLGRFFDQVRAHSVEGAVVFAFMDFRHTTEIEAAALPHFGRPAQMCVWVKDNAGMGTFYRSQHELVYVFKKGTAKHINNFELGQHGRYRTNVWQYAGANSFKDKTLLSLHPTVKPTPMIADAMRDCSHRQGLVLDPFAGSGTVLMAAERTGRYARAMELDPRYVDVGIRRWERLTKKKAVLAATGQTWAEVRQQRLAGDGARVVTAPSTAAAPEPAGALALPSPAPGPVGPGQLGLAF